MYVVSDAHFPAELIFCKLEIRNSDPSKTKNTKFTSIKFNSKLKVQQACCRHERSKIEENEEEDDGRSRKKRKRTSEDDEEVILFALPQLVHTPNKNKDRKKAEEWYDTVYRLVAHE